MQKIKLRIYRDQYKGDVDKIPEQTWKYYEFYYSKLEDEDIKHPEEKHFIVYDINGRHELPSRVYELEFID